IRRAFQRLAEAYPATLALEDLVTAPSGDAANHAETEARLRRALLTIIQAGRASASVLPIRVGRANQERPKAWPLARAEAASGQPGITNLHHVGIPAPPLLRALVAYLDGQHNRAELVARLAAGFEEGTVKAPGIPPKGSSRQFADLAEVHVERVLQH